MNLKRKKRPKMGLRVSPVIKCPGHLKWVRGHECMCLGKMEHIIVGDDYMVTPDRCVGRIEAHHSTTRGAGGGDETAVPLCAWHHASGHKMGWTTFQQRFGVDLASTAADLWKRSPHGQRYRLNQVGTIASGVTEDEVQNT